MKRYIKSSFSQSMPDWLRKRMSARFGGLKEKFLRKGVALDRAEFIDHEEPGCRPIYLLQTDYGQEIYAPGFNDDNTIMLNGRQRKLGAIAKSRLPELAVDTVYIDLTRDGGNMIENRERYEDPRYTYRYNRKGDYAGQYKRRDFKGMDEHGNSIYEDAGWSESGKIPGNESKARDKSGYRVPTPEQKIAEYYKKFPERVTNKVDAVYDRLIEVRSELLSSDFNTPVGYEDDNQAKAYRLFSEALHDYRKLLNDLGEDRRLKVDRDWSFSGNTPSGFAKEISYIMRNLDDIEKLLGL